MGTPRPEGLFVFRHDVCIHRRNIEHPREQEETTATPKNAAGGLYVGAKTGIVRPVSSLTNYRTNL